MDAPGREMERAIELGRSNNERWHIRKDGSLFWASGLLMPLRGESGEPIGFVKIMRDRTDIKLIEDERARLLADAEEARARAERQTKELEEANSVKDELLGLVSHELRTPLTTIMGTANVLVRRFDTLPRESILDAINDIWREAVRLDGLVENMLALSRVGASTVPDLEPVLLQRTIPTLIAEHRQRHPGCVIRIDHPGELPPVAAQPTYLQQVVENLISNAEKYSAGTTDVEVSLALTDDQKAVRVSVLDRGPGVPEEELPRLFEPFFRSEVTSGRVSGAGLGLAVCKRLVDILRGDIWASPRPGGGLQVSFTLPLWHNGDAESRE